MVRHRRARRFVMPEITLTPLIDTALTLLVIFMVTAPMVQHGIKIDLPAGQSKEVTAMQQEIVVTITKDGQLFFNSFPTDKKGVVARVQEALIGRAETPVYVRADESIAYGEVIAIVDQLKLAGVHMVAMSTRGVKIA